MTERDQKKLLDAGFRIIRRAIRVVGGEVCICFEELSPTARNWKMASGYFRDLKLVDKKHAELVTDPKTIEIR